MSERVEKVLLKQARSWSEAAAWPPTDGLECLLKEGANHVIYLLAEIDRFKAWVDDLQSDMYINCVYCGHRYGPNTEVPASMADVLKEHIEQCPKHPMSKLKAENQRLREAAKPFVEIETGNYFWKTRLSLVNEDAEYIHGSISIGDLRALAEAVKERE